MASMPRRPVPSLAIGQLARTVTPVRLEGQKALNRWTAGGKPGPLAASTSRNKNTGLLSTKPSRLSSGHGLSTARTIPKLRMTPRTDLKSSGVNTIYKYRAMPADTVSLLGRGATRNFQIGVKLD